VAHIRQSRPESANVAHIRQSRPGSGLVFQAQVRETVQGVPSSLGSGERDQRVSGTSAPPATRRAGGGGRRRRLHSGDRLRVGLW